MPDREKVMTGLELCTNISQDGCLMLCPYKDEKDETYSGFCEQVLKQDALALLKEQEETIRNREQEIRDKNERLKERAEQVDSMLKERKPVEPSRDIALNRRCPKCFAILKGKFCHKCGQAVKWDAD